MSDGLATTFRLLSKTNNDAAVRVLLPALDCPNVKLQEMALKAILERRSLAGGFEILRRIHDMPLSWQEVIRQKRGVLSGAIRGAILGKDEQMCRNACDAVVWFREYDLIPTLLNLLEEKSAKHADLGAETLMKLTSQLYEELAQPRDTHDRRNPQMVRDYVVSSLELSVRRFGRHKRREVIEAFLMLAARDNVTLKQVLQDPHHVAFLVMVDLLSRGTHGGILRLLLRFLDDFQAPSAAITAMANRCDLRFVRHWLSKIEREPTAAMAQNLKRINSIRWLGSGQMLLEELDDTEQSAAVHLLMNSGIPRLQVYHTIEILLARGRPSGRRAAAAALAAFNGTEANAAALRALGDPDPQVQAIIAGQLRRRGIPGILPRLVELVDSPHAVVRDAVRESLSEFSFKRFVAAFDMLDDEVRRSTGRLVKKVDPQAAHLLRDEMKSRSRTRRLRAAAIAQTIDLVEALETTLVELLSDEDHLVRAEAAAALAVAHSDTSRQALEDALHDRSVIVQQSAQKSLSRRTGGGQADARSISRRSSLGEGDSPSPTADDLASFLAAMTTSTTTSRSGSL